jgi:hypothetical protein
MRASRQNVKNVLRILQPRLRVLLILPSAQTDARYQEANNYVIKMLTVSSIPEITH